MTQMLKVLVQQQSELLVQRKQEILVQNRQQLHSESAVATAAAAAIQEDPTNEELASKHL